MNKYGVRVEYEHELVLNKEANSFSKKLWVHDAGISPPPQFTNQNFM